MIMKKIAVLSWIIFFLFTIIPGTVLANGDDDEGHHMMYDFGHHMWPGVGHGFLGLGWFIEVLLVIVLILAIIYLMRLIFIPKNKEY
jgi:hypothetical protein